MNVKAYELQNLNQLQKMTPRRLSEEPQLQIMTSTRSIHHTKENKGDVKPLPLPQSHIIVNF